MLHKWMFGCILPIIFGDGISSNMESLRKEYSLEKIVQELIIIAGRRSGKTTAVQIFVAACMLHIPGFIGLAFAMVLRTARSMIAGIQKFLAGHPLGVKMMTESKMDSITLVNPNDSSDVRTCMCLPSRSDVCMIVPFFSFAFGFYSFFFQT